MPKKGECLNTFDAHCSSFYGIVAVMHLSSASTRRGGGSRTDMGTLLIVHFKVHVFPHRWKILSSKVPVNLGKKKQTTSCNSF